MTLLLDVLAVAIVIGAIAFLWKARRAGCADCASRRRGAESRVALADLRASARRAADRR
jgi:hypothetical protein